MTQSGVGEATGGKPINLAQLQTEIQAAGVDVSAGLGMDVDMDMVFTYVNSMAADFASVDMSTVDSVIAAHVAMRDKTDAEYADEYQTANSQRRSTINSIMNGLLPRDQVPM